MQTRRYLSSTQNTSENSQTQSDQNETSENPQSQKVLNEMQAQLKVLEEKNTELLVNNCYTISVDCCITTKIYFNLLCTRINIDDLWLRGKIYGNV